MILATHGIIGSKAATAVPTSDIIQANLCLNLNTQNTASYTGVNTPWTDLSTKGNNAVATGIGIPAYTGTQLSYLFDGQNDAFTFTNVGFPTGNSNITIGMWIYLPSTAFYGNNPGVFSYGSLSSGALIDIYYRGNQNQFSIFNGGTDLTSTTTLSLNTWYNICVVYSVSEGKMSFYVNGVLAGPTLSMTANFPVSPDYKNIGKRFVVDNYYINMYCGRVYAYSSALTTVEVLSNFDNTKSAFGYSTDTDAQAFITAAGLNKLNEINAVNTLVLDLKGLNTVRNPTAINLWNKFLAIYPFVGATENAHKFNLKNPVNTNAAYRLSFGGSWNNTTSVGAIGSANGFADTFLPSNLLGQNSASVWYYRRNDPDYSSALMGVFDSASNKNGIQMHVRSGGGSYSCLMSHEEGEDDAGLFKTGLIGLSRTVSSGYRRYARFNGTVSATTLYNSFTGGGRASNSQSLTTFSIFINARNAGGTVQEYSVGTCQFAAIGSAFIDAEAAALNNIVQFCQTTLGRNIY